METKKIKELNIRITKPEIWIKPYKDIVIPKGMRLIKVWELFWIFESKYKDFLFSEKGWLDFACKQLDCDIKNNYSRWVYRSGDGDLVAGGGSLLSASSDGRVVFVKGAKDEN
jgi:hypothetical protein